MTMQLARALSILGHPLLVLPTVLLLLSARGSNPRFLLAMTLGFAGFVAIVLGWSWWQVRHGRWQHIDASQSGERQSLNLFLLALLILAAMFTWSALNNLRLALGLIVAAALIAVAILTAQWWKLSLHVAFAAYAVALLWPIGTLATFAGSLFVLGVAWSRLRLARHQMLDLVIGALTGCAAGLSFWQLHRYWNVTS